MHIFANFYLEYASNQIQHFTTLQAFVSGDIPAFLHY